MQSAEQSKNQAIQAENLAKKWASNPQNQIVQEGKYSAYHYALEAEKHAEKVKATAEGRKDWNFIDNVPISKDINDSSETKLASAFSVKTAYDKAVEAEKIANGKSNFKIEQGKDNADDYKTDGHYYFASGLNLPDSKNQKQDSEATSSAWHVEVVSGGQTTAVRQIARKANDTGVKTRFFNGSIWTAWKSVGGDGVPLGAIVAFPKEIEHPTGFLKCDGSTIEQRTYPDLYRTLGNKNTLPNLTRSDVGMTAYFATDEIPNGWVEFDKIRDEVTQEKYPELHKYLTKKYGGIQNVPKAEDRFLRNAANELVVGRVQEDAIKTHSLNYGTNHNSSNYQYHVDNNDTIATGNNKTADNYKIRTNGAIFYSGAEETRPKSLVLKLCIKAKNTFDDVQFWIKAFGAVENQGVLDASAIVQEMQDFKQQAEEKIQSITVQKEEIMHAIQEEMGKSDYSLVKVWEGSKSIDYYSKQFSVTLNEPCFGTTVFMCFKERGYYSKSPYKLAVLSFEVLSKSEMEEASHYIALSPNDWKGGNKDSYGMDYVSKIEISSTGKDLIINNIGIECKKIYIKKPNNRKAT
nr:tail fiber protein [Histophilus somni]